MVGGVGHPALIGTKTAQPIFFARLYRQWLARITIFISAVCTNLPRFGRYKEKLRAKGLATEPLDAELHKEFNNNRRLP